MILAYWNEGYEEELRTLLPIRRYHPRFVFSCLPSLHSCLCRVAVQKGRHHQSLSGNMRVAL